MSMILPVGSSYLRHVIPAGDLSYVHGVIRQVTDNLTNIKADWIRRAGVAIALAGAIVATPDGTAWAYRTALKGARSFGKWLAALLQLPQRIKGAAKLAGESGGASEALEVTKWQDWCDDVSDSDKIEVLHQQVELVRQHVAAAREHTRNVETRLLRELSEVDTCHGERLRQLVGAMAAQHRQSSRVDSRGIWPIGLGILLTGIPDELASAPLPLGLAIAAVAVLVTLVAIIRWWPDFRQALRSE